LKRFLNSKKKLLVKMKKSLVNQTIVIASHNKGKIKEFKSLMSKFNLRILTSSEIKIGNVTETGKSFKENARIKALSIPKTFISIADDSGLCIRSLNGRPGVFSSRLSSKCGGWYNAMKKLYTEIRGKKNPDYCAKFYCTIAIRWTNGDLNFYTGEVKGEITWPPAGKNGFGYDPFFIPKNYKKTFGQMLHSEKILIDHRYEAFKKLAKEHLLNN